MNFHEVDPKPFKRYLKTVALIDTVNGYEIWRSQYGFSRLVKRDGDKVYISDRDCLSIKEAREVASKL